MFGGSSNDKSKDAASESPSTPTLKAPMQQQLGKPNAPPSQASGLTSAPLACGSTMSTSEPAGQLGSAPSLTPVQSASCGPVHLLHAGWHATQRTGPVWLELHVATRVKFCSVYSSARHSGHTSHSVFCPRVVRFPGLQGEAINSPGSHVPHASHSMLCSRVAAPVTYCPGGHDSSKGLQLVAVGYNYQLLV